MICFSEKKLTLSLRARLDQKHVYLPSGSPNKTENISAFKRVLHAPQA
jgi:hypothetical protein